MGVTCWVDLCEFPWLQGCRTAPSIAILPHSFISVEAAAPSGTRRSALLEFLSFVSKTFGTKRWEASRNTSTEREWRRRWRTPDPHPGQLCGSWLRISAMPEIEIAAVVGVYHPRWDERPIADTRWQAAAKTPNNLQSAVTELISWWMVRLEVPLFTDAVTL